MTRRCSWGPDYPDPQTNAGSFAWNDNNADDASTGTLAWRNTYDPGPLNDITAAAVMAVDSCIKIIQSDMYTVQCVAVIISRAKS